MFATGSHDGAVRIWTEIAAQRSSISALETTLPFTRSLSPDIMDIPRTESPVAQQELESTFANSVENLGTGPSSTFANRERMVAFAAAHTGSPTVDLDTRGRTL